MFCLLASLVGLWCPVTLAIILYILLGKPNRFMLDLNPVHFRLPLPNINDNNYVRNKRIVKCDKLHQTNVLCPKSIAIDICNRKLYTGTIDGKVYCIEEDGNQEQKMETVANFQNGRPLGMRLSSNKDILYFTEANSGLYAYDLKTKTLRHLLDLSRTKFIDGKASKFIDDLAIIEQDDNTFIYMTDVSRKFPVDMWCYTYLETDSTGRILRYDVNNDIVTVVIENLCFPNGIEVTKNNDALLICELTKRRILKHSLTGKNATMTSVLFDNLPGEPENIRRSANCDTESYWIGLALTRDYNNKLSFLDNYCTEPILRKLILRSSYIIGSVLHYCGNLFNNQSLKGRGQNLKTGLALILADFMEYPGMALEIDFTGNVLQTLQVKDDVSVISEIQEIPTKNGTRIFYTGSSGGSLGKIIVDN